MPWKLTLTASHGGELASCTVDSPYENDIATLLAHSDAHEIAEAEASEGDSLSFEWRDDGDDD